MNLGTIRFILAQSGLDRKIWESEREGLDYSEAPPEPERVDFNLTETDPEGWIIALRYIAIAVLAGLLIYIVVRIVLQKRRKKSKVESVVKESESSEESPTAISSAAALRDALERAKAEKNYREAIRILYQMAIKKLADSGKLIAAPDKTAREYVSELNNRSDEFLKITLIHEYIWYGESEPTEAEFNRAEPGFTTFINSVSDGE
jgi:hypothetical protein